MIFMEDPPRKFFRLKPGGEVRLRYAYIIKCEEVMKDDAGEVVALRCSYDPNTKSGMPDASRKVKGTIHWVECPGSCSRQKSGFMIGCFPRPIRKPMWKISTRI